MVLVILADFGIYYYASVNVLLFLNAKRVNNIEYKPWIY